MTDVAELISASVESRKMFLTEVTRTCLEAAKKEKIDSHQMISSQIGQPITTSARTTLNTCSSSGAATKPVTAVFNTSGTEMKRRIEGGKPNQAVTLLPQLE